VVVNNAGYGLFGPLEMVRAKLDGHRQSLDDWEEVSLTTASR